MGHRQKQSERADLISAMFALLTGPLEDAAAAAVECQGRLPVKALRTQNRAIETNISEAATLSAALAALLEDES